MTSAPMWLPSWLVPDARAELLAAGIWQWLALTVAAIVAVLIARHQRRRRGAEGRKYGAVDKLVTPTAFGVLTLVAAALLSAADSSGALLALAALLASGLALVRLLLHGLLRVIWRGSLFAVFETAIAWTVWLVLALVWLGWLEPAIDAIDAVAIPFGGGQVSVLDAVRSVFILLLFLAAASYLGAFAERRLLVVANLPIGFRVGLAKSLRVMLIVVAILVTFGAVGLDLTTLTVIGGALGVGIGFGLQRVTSNFVSGFILLGDRSIRPGDVISVGERFGVVRELRARYVVVRDRDGVDTLIPNENIITSEVINWSYADRNIRLKLPVQISFRDDPRQAMALLEEAARQHPRVDSQPLPAARIMEFGDNGIHLELRFWIRDPEDGVNNVRSDLYLAVWESFQAHGITIPYPQLVMYQAGVVPESSRPAGSGHS